jgi:putative IMPACT (imprinted ancient) family translation regulator
MQDFDDDGEAGAGSRLLKLLQIVNACNVIVVVSRWYGGILLGPSRFQFITNAARSLLDECGYIKAKPGHAKK